MFARRIQSLVQFEGWIGNWAMNILVTHKLPHTCPKKSFSINFWDLDDCKFGDIFSDGCAKTSMHGRVTFSNQEKLSFPSSLPSLLPPSFPPFLLVWVHVVCVGAYVYDDECKCVSVYSSQALTLGVFLSVSIVCLELVSYWTLDYWFGNTGLVVNAGIEMCIPSIWVSDL